MPDITINDRGAVLIDKALTIDGHSTNPLRVVTHIHSDHVRDLSKSVNHCRGVVATPLTLDWLIELGHKVGKGNCLKLDYGSKIKIDGLEVTFERAYHIPGTSQVVTTDGDGLKTVYTSDFKKPGKGTPIVDCDVLIIDAVYGNPSHIREFDDYIEDVLTDLVRQLLSKGPVVIQGYHGKLQEVMQVLRANGVDAPILLTPKVYRLTQVAEKHGLKVSNYVSVDSEDGAEVMRTKWFLMMDHVNSRYSRNLNGFKASKILLSGWEFKKPYRYLGYSKWLVAFSDHADFKGLMDYVINSNPKLVIVNSVRSSYADLFADAVRRTAKKECVVMP
ncbi:MAG: MBL fold metallo-hydrolase [Sulfolobales archaeon]|nr:MBL fold metallo-hydrolase [Sulfolobales archaeon]MCX8185753.1 MBL fold metallo-hydrolase [Sulfolobales archaeon]MDW7970039.1 MBL fold metallo-hydrolase [Sulfolobales archaeon]